jgi:hypothetical protein
MALLDDLFAPPATSGPGGAAIGAFMPPKDPDDGYADIDYTGGSPIYRRRKTAEDEADEADKKMGADKKRMDEARPYVPASNATFGPVPGAPQPQTMPAPGLGMLGPEMNGPYGAVAPIAPGAPAPPLQTAEVKPAPQANTGNVPQVPNPAAFNAQAADAPPERDEQTGAIDLTHQPLGMLGKAWDTINGGIKNNSNLLLNMGAGMVGAPSWAQGLSRGFSGAAAGAQQDYRQQQATSQQQALYTTLRQAMIKNGVDPREASLQAFAGMNNPKLAETLIQNHIADRKATIEKLDDGFGGQRLVKISPYMSQGELDRINSGENGTESTPPSGGSPGTDVTPGGASMFAPGITPQNFDHSKVGEEYLGQFGPEMQATVKNYLAGQSQLTGRQKEQQAIKRVAQKYAADMGIPADDASLAQRKIWGNSLGDTTKGVGLQSKGFHQGLEHFVKLSDNLVKMNLSNGLGLEPLARGVNNVKNLTTDQQLLVHKNDVIGAALSREMGNLFSKNGGGVKEAADTKKHVSDALMSRKSAAGSLEAIDELVGGGLHALEERRDQLFPMGNAPKGSEFLGPTQQAQLEHIRNNIAILKGEASPEPAGAAPSAPTATGPNGHQITVRNGRWVDAKTGEPVK